MIHQDTITATPTKSRPDHKPDTLTVIEAIRTALVNGTYVPNQRLTEVDLCEELGASRGTIRIALAALANEGLIEIVPHRGAHVRAVPLSEAIEITEVRIAIESLCAAKVCEQITTAETSEFRQLASTMTEAVQSGDLAAYSEANKTLHKRIIEISGQKTAAAVLSRLRGQSVRHQFRLAMQAGRPAVSLPEHLEIIDAVCNRDEARARKAIEVHLKSVIDALRQTEEQQKAGPVGS